MTGDEQEMSSGAFLGAPYSTCRRPHTPLARGEMSVENTWWKSLFVLPGLKDTPLATGHEGARTADDQILTNRGSLDMMSCLSLFRLERLDGSKKPIRKYLFPGGRRCTYRNCEIADRVVLTVCAGMATPKREGLYVCVCVCVCVCVPR